MDQITSVSYALGNTTSYTYKANGNLIALADAKGNTTQFEYNKGGVKLGISFSIVCVNEDRCHVKPE